MKKREADRPFPWRCGQCDEKEVYRTATEYRTTIKYEGRPYEVVVPDLEVPKCRKCGEVVFDNVAGDQIDRAFRSQLGLLQAPEIWEGRTQLGLSQKQFAADLGVAEESISRWETGGQIQSRIVDRLIRLYFEFTSVREALRQIVQGKTIGQAPRTAPAVDRAESSLGIQRHWFAAYVNPHSKMTEPIAAHLSRFTGDLEEIQESEAGALLEQFSRFLDMWKTRKATAGQPSSPESIE